MRVTEIIADLQVTDLEAAKDFYTGYLGLTVEEFNLGWVARFTSPQSGINIQLVTRDATAPESPVISVRVDDIDAAYTQAAERGYKIVHPSTTEEWGVTRFFVQAPHGNILNVVEHRY
jgi:predicted enzyme related to lactoylglutathione lyase